MRNLRVVGTGSATSNDFPRLFGARRRPLEIFASESRRRSEKSPQRQTSHGRYQTVAEVPSFRWTVLRHSASFPRSFGDIFVDDDDDGESRVRVRLCVSVGERKRER